MTQWSLDFDGTNDYVGCGDVPTGGLAALTVECWLRLDADETGAAVAKWTASAGDQEWKLEIASGQTITVSVCDADQAVKTVTGAIKLDAGTWYHVALVWDDTTLALYVDGVLDGDTATTGEKIQSTTQAVEFGRLGTDYASMRLAWVRISDAVRYSAPFTPLRTPAFPDANTLAQWDFIEGIGTSLNNRESTADYDGTISGATWRWDAPERSDLWGAGYERFGDAWTVLVGGTDRTAVTALDSLSILEDIGSNRDTAVFRLEDVAASAAPSTWSHVQIWHGGSLLFGGYVVAKDLLVKGVALDVVCHCVDWTVLLDKRVAAESTTYTGQDALTILKDITENNWVPELDATVYTETGATSIDLDVNYPYVVDLVQSLAELSGVSWFVREDEEGDLYLYFTDDAWPAPFGLSTSPDMSTTMPVRVLQWSVSGLDRTNKVYVLVDDTYSTSYSTWEPPLLLLEGVIKVSSAEEELIGSNVLDELDDDRVTGRIEIGYGGVHAGMTIAIDHDVLDVDASYLVHQVRIKPEGGGSVGYELTVSNFKQPEPTARDEWRKVWKRL